MHIYPGLLHYYYYSFCRFLERRDLKLHIIYSTLFLDIHTKVVHKTVYIHSWHSICYMNIYRFMDYFCIYIV